MFTNQTDKTHIWWPKRANNSHNQIRITTYKIPHSSKSYHAVPLLWRLPPKKPSQTFTFHIEFCELDYSSVIKSSTGNITIPAGIYSKLTEPNPMKKKLWLANYSSTLEHICHHKHTLLQKNCENTNTIISEPFSTRFANPRWAILRPDKVTYNQKALQQFLQWCQQVHERDEQGFKSNRSSSSTKSPAKFGHSRKNDKIKTRTSKQVRSSPKQPQLKNR